MALHDKELEQELLAALKHLEQDLISAIGPTPLRRRLSELIVAARIAIKNFDQDTYEGLIK